METRDFPTADEIAGARLDAEAEAWMKQHASNICYFWKYTADPTRYDGWNEAECRKHWPEFWTLWRQFVRAEAALDTQVGNVATRYGFGILTTAGDVLP